MGSWKVLAIDDDAPTRSLLKALLGHHGHQCIEAGDGREALNLLSPDAFDVLLLDLLLPDYDGFELLRTMKASHPEMVPRTIVITAAAERTYAGRAELDGVWGILRKPIEIAEVVEEIESCAEQRPRNVRKNPLRVESPPPNSWEQSG